MLDGFWWIIAKSANEHQGRGRTSENLDVWITLDEAAALSGLKHYQGNDWPALIEQIQDGGCTIVEPVQK